ncbi:uridine kinase [Bacillus anthracis]|uniref:Phosphoribulokinase/uridine kinase domain-containing protein n=1 Tax=Bacillus tropicus TaxID=2026188 RepID=A0ABD7ZXE3_9BACI|nr:MULTISPECIES: uridine kinase [Bacillus]PED55860.1 uridine kinase [Bacillus anthracis]PEU87077.1 uridine kinase [Bacillus cereus]PFT26671.1 uridine kinase [Bacillus thuringiensis]PEF66779.1 uridine kinase [Bacillus anthracis]PET34423.1 uridine kinase [Bacillus anthracis]
MCRKQNIKEIIDRILTLKLTHPIRVGVSGITASGKTTFANELAEEIKKRGLPVTRASIDDFHNPRLIRYAQGKESAKGYYEDAHDYTAFKERLLKPLGPNGDLQYETISHNLITDIPVYNTPIFAQPNMVLIVDGTFLLKKDVAYLFDYKIFVDTNFEIARKRGAKRETEAFGSYKEAEKMFLNRYHAACKMYIEEHNPKDCADVVFRNSDLAKPELIFQERM